MSEIKRVRVTCPLGGETHQEKFVERAEMVGIPIYRKIAAVKDNYMTSEEALKEICAIYAEVILDWNLVDASGKELPKPHQNPKALMMLAEADADAFIWVGRVVNSSIDTLLEPPKG